MRHPFLALLVCPLCSRPLRSPLTLPCGHSICAHHYTNPCPIPSCSYTSRPSSSGVLDFPPQPQIDLYASPPKVDVTINKVLDLLSRPVSSPDTHDDNRFLPPRNNDQHPDENDGENTGYRGKTSTHRQRASPPLSDRPHKRRRRYTSPSEHDPTEQDLLQHIRQETVRQRDVPPDVPLLSTPDDYSITTSSTPMARSESPSANVSFEKDLLSELTCQICYALLYQPITTPCQHTFCYRCLHRSLDHNSLCPLCRHTIPGYAYFLDHPCNKLILALITKAFPAEYTGRGNAIAAEEREARLKTPILVGQLSFPGITYAIHIFEPRYRLMLRRCLESPNPRFGVMPPSTTANLSHVGGYGTMVTIQRVRMHSDGRSFLQTIGAQRFRILEQGTLDGYTVARVEMVEDFPDESDDWSDVPPASGSSSRIISAPTLPICPTDAELDSICREFLVQMQQAPWTGQRMNFAYGEPPSDTSALSYYVAAVLPIDVHEKAKLLPLRTSRLRLRLVVHWIEQLIGPDNCSHGSLPPLGGT